MVKMKDEKLDENMNLLSCTRIDINGDTFIISTLKEEKMSKKGKCKKGSGTTKPKPKKY
jgi:hypothetical protein